MRFYNEQDLDATANRQTRSSFIDRIELTLELVDLDSVDVPLAANKVAETPSIPQVLVPGAEQVASAILDDILETISAKVRFD